MVVDLFLVYSFIKRLVTPFNKWDAYKEGIIDEKGNILIRRRDFTKVSQRKAFGVFDQMILNLKKLLAKLPGGQTRLGSYAAALWLIKEEQRMEKAGVLNENSDLNESYFEEAVQRFLEENSDILEEAEKKEMTSVGSGAIAGLGVGPQGEPGVSKAAQKKHKKKNFKVLKRELEEADMKRFNEFTEDLNEANFKPGNLKLNNGQSVKLTRDDAKALAALMKSVDSKNSKEMEKTLMKDKEGFEEILGFAKEAL